MENNEKSIIDQLYFELYFELAPEMHWTPAIKELFEQARNIHRQEIEQAFTEGSKLKFINEDSFSQALEARFEARIFYNSKYKDDE